MGDSDLECSGGEIWTRNLNRLAGDGLLFTNCYSENMCWVSRAALIGRDFTPRKASNELWLARFTSHCRVCRQGT
jgi:hypothetical protein